MIYNKFIGFLLLISVLSFSIQKLSESKTRKESVFEKSSWFSIIDTIQKFSYLCEFSI